MRGLFGSFVDRVEAKAVQFDAAFERFFELNKSRSGGVVTIDKALSVTVVLACARVIAEGCAQLPLQVVRKPLRDKGKREVIYEHGVTRLLTRRPNDWMTAFEFREALTMHAVLTHGGFAFINRVGKEPRELIPLVPGSVAVRQEDDYEVFYDVYDGKELLGTYGRDEILHLRGPTWDTVMGIDVTRQAREAIGLAIATEATHASLHANGARPGGVLSVERELSKAAREKLKAQWEELSKGVNNHFRTVVIDGKTEWKPLGFSGVDNQHLELRKFQIEEICRALKVFPQMIGHAGDQSPTFASAEAFFSAHIRETIRPWAERWRQVIDRDLLDSAGDLEPEFDFRALSVGNLKDLAEYNAKALGSGGAPAWETQNEVRSRMGLDPIDGGDELPKPTNVAAGATAKESAPKGGE